MFKFELIHGRPDLVVELRQKIVRYKKRNPTLTSKDIAKRFGISAPTFNRLENLELKKPSFEQIVKVLRGVGQNDEVISFLSKYYPDIVESVQEHLEDERKEKEEMSTDVVKMMSCTENGRIFRYILSNNKKINKDEIQKYFGLVGIEAANRLQSKGYIRYQNDAYHVVGSLSTKDFVNLKNVILREIEESFDAEGKREGTALNFMRYISRPVNLERVLPIIVSEYKKFHTHIDEILSKEENKGDTPIWIASLADTMMKNQLAEKLNGENDEI